MRENMKRMSQLLIGGFVAVMLNVQVSVAQKFDEERMERDIAVAENVLSTLIKQQFSNQRTFFPLEIKGSYQAGYGVTFTLPADYTTPIAFTLGSADNNTVVFWKEPPGVNVNNGFNYYYDGREGPENSDDQNPTKITTEKTVRLKDKTKEKMRLDMDSVRDAYNNKVIEASKTFIVDYADMIAQLQPGERVVISNQGNQPRMWVGQYFNAPKRSHLSIEALKSDLTQARQGKLTRDQMLAKIKVVNTETADTVEPDLELFSSIMGRLYSQDLSKTFLLATRFISSA